MKKGSSEQLTASLEAELRALEQTDDRPDAADLCAIPEALDWSRGNAIRGHFFAPTQASASKQMVVAQDERNECNIRFQFILDVLEDAKPLLSPPMGVMQEHAARMWLLLDEVSAALASGGYKRPESTEGKTP